MPKRKIPESPFAIWREASEIIDQAPDGSEDAWTAEPAHRARGATRAVGIMALFSPAVATTCVIAQFPEATATVDVASLMLTVGYATLTAYFHSTARQELQQAYDLQALAAEASQPPSQPLMFVELA